MHDVIVNVLLAVLDAVEIADLLVMVDAQDVIKDAPVVLEGVTELAVIVAEIVAMAIVEEDVALDAADAPDAIVLVPLIALKDVYLHV